MKRFLVLFAVLVPLSLFIAGCGGMGGSSATTEMTPAQKEQAQAKMKAQMKAEMEQSITKKPMMDRMLENK